LGSDILIELLKSRKDLDKISKKLNLSIALLFEKVNNYDLTISELKKLKRILKVKSLHFILA
jgi:hypothetical protein